MTQRLWQIVLWPALAVLFLGIAYLLISTTFMLYDDEGYVLVSLKNYLAGGRLYDEIFSQYGPWPYVYHQLITTVLAEPMTHQLGRWLTAGHWAGCALLAGAIAWRLTLSLPAAVASAATTFGLLWQMSAEPTHPGSLISLMVATAVYAAVRLPELARPYLAAGWIGLVTALLILTKINVGLLMFAGAACAALRFTAWPGSWRRPAAWLGALGFLLVPWGLMGRKLEESWVLIFAVHFALGAAALLWVTPPATAPRLLRPFSWVMAAAAGMAACLVVSATVCFHGTSPGALLRAVLVSPWQHPASFIFGFSWPPLSGLVAVVALGLSGRAGWELRRHGAVSPLTARWIALARLLALGVFLWHCGTWLTIFGVGRFITVCLTLLPLFAVPLTASAGPEESTMSRSLAPRLGAILALPQVLHAFPVAGSQMGWGTFALVPFFIAGIHESLRVLPPRPGLARKVLVPMVWSLLLAINAWQLWLLGTNGWQRYHTAKPLDLPGAEDVRAEGPIRQTLRLLTLNASVHAEVLFSRPGMFSYNLWSGASTPTAQNATHWFWLLDNIAQERIVHVLESTPRNAVIVNHRLDEFLTKIDVPMTGPLQSHIQENYRALFSAGYQSQLGSSAFSFLVPHQSRAVPFGKLEALVKAEPEPDGREPVLLRANVALDGRPVQVRLIGASYPWRVLQDYTAQGAKIYLEPINTSGDQLAPPFSLPVNTPLRGLFRVSVYADENPKPARPHDVVLILSDESGRVLAEAVF